MHAAFWSGTYQAGITLTPTDWITAAGVFVTALATLSIAAFAYVTIRRDQRRAEERRKSVDVSIAVDASLLQRSIDKSLETAWPEDDWTLEQMTDRARTFQRGYVDMTHRADAIATASGDATENVAKAARNAFFLFYRAADRINDVEARAYDQEQARLQLKQARHELSDCRLQLTELVPREYLPPIVIRVEPVSMGFQVLPVEAGTEQRPPRQDEGGHSTN